MKKTLLTAMALGAILFNANAQTTTAQLYTPNATSVLETKNNTGTTAGFVGIGTSTPFANLDVNGDIRSKKFEVYTGASGNAFNIQQTFGRAGATTTITENGIFTSPVTGGSINIGLGYRSGLTKPVFSGYTGNLVINSNSGDLGVFSSKSLVLGGNNTAHLTILPSGGVTIGTAPTDNSATPVTLTNYKLAVTGGNVIIGSGFKYQNPLPDGFRLYVEKGILTERLKVGVKLTDDWSDYVFAPTYKLNTLDSVETFIKANKHLPDVPSAAQVVENGIDVAKMDAKLLQKIEELTLYVIDINKKVIEQDKKIQVLEAENKELKK